MNSTYHMLRLQFGEKRIFTRINGILCWTFWNQHVFGFGELYDTLNFLEKKTQRSPKVPSKPLYCTYKKTGVYK